MLLVAFLFIMQIGIIDPDCRLIGLHLYDGLFKVSPVCYLCFQEFRSFILGVKLHIHITKRVLYVAPISCP